ncbi:serine/threonine-protein kinase [Spirillospora sp. CA-253888]
MPESLRSEDPRQLGPYRLKARLGQGGMGTVFLGEDAEGHEVAVKVIKADLSEDAAFQERFRREVTAARRVRGFCTAAVLDARLDGAPLYVVTEYVNGLTLEEAVRRDRPIRGGDLEALAVGIATALKAIRDAGIVHRDLKPANVLLSPTGPRVIDFGIARTLDAVDGPTPSGQFMGTPAYIAPEIVNGGPVSPAADVFAWGCVVAFAGTGRKPFDGKTTLEIIRRVAEAEPDLNGLDPALHEPVRRALEKDPEQRPKIDEILKWLTGSSTPDPTSVLPVEERPSESVPAPEGEGPEQPSAEAEAPSEDSGSPGGGWPQRIGLIVIAIGIGGFIGWLTQSGEEDPKVYRAPLQPAAPTDGPPATGASLVQKETFTDDSGGWGAGGCGFIDQEELAIEADAASSARRCVLPTALSPRNGSSTLHEVQVKIDKDGKGYAGLHLLSRNDDRYEVMLRQDGTVRLRKVVGGKPTFAKTAKVASYTPGGFVRLQVEVDLTRPNTRLRVWAEGKSVFPSPYVDTVGSLRRGTDALAVHPAGTGANSLITGRFDDYEMSEIT